MSVLDWFKPTKLVQKTSTWKELGNYTAQFNSFGSNIYQSEIVRACIRPLSEHTSKANAVSNDNRIAKVLNESPNLYMNGKDFLAKVRTRLELINTVFIYIGRDNTGKAVSFYPVPYSWFEALEYQNGLFIKFHFTGSSEALVLPWADLAVIRKDYNKSDIAGDSNDAILNMLEIINTTNQGISNAVKATANLRGILKSTKAMLSDKDIKAQKERFVADYLNLENEGGIASLDATQEFTPISMNPTITSWETSKELRENIYRYFGVSDAIIMSTYTEQQMEAFYDSRIEPFLVALSTELTRKVFTPRELGYGNHIVYESNRIQYSSTATKLNMVQLVDRGALTPNEWRAIFNLAPIDGGDEPIRRLDTEVVNDNNVQKQNEAEE
jgi:HK97 family phage portal protein